MHLHPFLQRSDIEKRGVQPDPQKVKALTDMPVPNNKKELQAFLGTINYLGKFSPGTADVCDPLHKLISSRVTWTWNASYQSLFNKAKLFIKSDMCMKFYICVDFSFCCIAVNASKFSLWQNIPVVL